jgi:hypothetical protein
VYTERDVRPYLGKTVEFKTPWGVHHGIVRVTNFNAVLMELPSEYVKTSLERDVGLNAVHAGFFGGADGCYPQHRPFGGGCCWIPFVFIFFIALCPFFWCW